MSIELKDKEIRIRIRIRIRIHLLIPQWGKFIATEAQKIVI